MSQPAEPQPDVVPVTPAAASCRDSSVVPSSLAALPPVGEFTRLALWMAGSLAGVATPTHAALAGHYRMMAKRVGWTASASKRQRPPPADALSLLAEAVIGTSRAAVASVFGLPSCAAAAEDAAGTADDVWLGPTWYYPVQSPAAVAVVIEFDGGQAHRVVFVGLEQIRS